MRAHLKRAGPARVHAASAQDPRAVGVLSVLMAAKVALGHKEPLHGRRVVVPAPASSDKPGPPPSRNGSSAAAAVLEPSGSNVAPTTMQQQEEQQPLACSRLTCSCASPRVLSCDQTVAHLAWDPPTYVQAAADGAALPPLVWRSFEIFWVGGEVL